MSEFMENVVKNTDQNRTNGNGKAAAGSYFGQTKTAFVRQVLKEIGALSEDNAPAGWVHEVERRLSENNLSMHRNMIYLTRRNMLRTQGDGEGQSKQNVAKNHSNTKQFVDDDESLDLDILKSPQLQISALHAVRNLAARFGGLKQLGEVVEFMISLRDNRL